MRLLTLILVAVTASCSGVAEDDPVNDGAVVQGTCADDAACAGLDDGDRCNGLMRCDPASGRCAVDPATVVACDPGEAGPCQVVRCLAESGQCAPEALADGTPCEDGDGCTLGDVCADGSCEPGASSACECKQDTDCADDGDLCNGTPYCAKGALPWRCKTNPATVVACKPPLNSCRQTTCKASTGACVETSVSDGQSCDDGNSCTVADSCLAGQCGGKETCTCAVDADCVDDGDACNGLPYCDKAAGACKIQPSTVVTCYAGADTTCNKNTCQTSSGLCVMEPVQDKTSCDDDESCTTGDHCLGGKCAGGTNTCLCKTNADCAALDDGNLCNGVHFCDKSSGHCKPNPASTVVCPSVADSQCAANTCVPESGVCAMTPVHEGMGCDDDDPCSVGEVCTSGKCVATTSACECKTDADCAGHDDGDLCNGTWFCLVGQGKSACTFNPATKIYCAHDQNTECLVATCQPKTGACKLMPVAAGSPCDDGDPCIDDTTCAGASCQGGKAADCDDGFGCTIDACKPGQGCTHAVKDCDDGNGCTTGGCDAISGGCKLGPVAAGTACDADQDGCTVADACDGKGACVAGKTAACSDNAAPCQQLTCQSKTATSFTCKPAPKADGSPCADAPGACLVGATCDKGACKPGKTARHFQKTSAPAGGSAWFERLAAHLDGTLVAVGGWKTKSVSGSSWLIQATSATGTPLWQVVRKADKPHAEHLAEGVVADTDGTTWVLGTASTAKHALEMELIRLDAKGKQVGAWRYHDPGAGALTANGPKQYERATQMLRGPGNTLLLIGSSTKKTYTNTNRAMFLVQVDLQGKPMWLLPYRAVHAKYRPVVGLNDEGVMRIGRPTYWGGKQGWWEGWLRLGNTKPIFDNWWGAGASPKLTRGAVGVGKAVISAAQSAGNKFGLRRTTPKGGNWNNTSAPAGVHASALALRPGGGLLIAGQTTAPDRQAWWGRADATGNFQQGWTYGGVGDDHARAVLDLADGTVALAGWHTIGGSKRAWLARVGHWGQATCAEDACSKVKPEGCDDDQPCTRDRCDAKTGCSHEAGAKFRCDPPNACSESGACKEGTCVGSVSGRYRARRLRATTKYGPTAGIAQAGPDSYRAFLFKRLAYNSTGQAYAVRADGSDIEPSHGNPFSKCLATAADRIVPWTGGRYLLVGYSKLSKGALAMFCAGQFAYYAPHWQLKVGAPCGSSCRALARDASPFADGSLFAAIQLPDDGNGAAMVAHIVPSYANKTWKVSATTTTIEHVSRSLEPYAIASMADASSVLAGRSTLGKNSKGLLIRVGHDGKELFRREPDQGTVLYALAVRPGQRIIAVGEKESDGRRSWLVAHDLAGNLLWSRLPPVADNIRLMAINLLPDQNMVVAGDRLTPSKPRIHISRRHEAGATLWQRDHHAWLDKASYLTRNVMMGTPDGGWLLGAGVGSSTTTAKSAARYPALLRVGPWGELDCGATGACHDKTMADCDDGDPCTADLCQPAKGCVIKPIQGCKDGS